MRRTPKMSEDLWETFVNSKDIPGTQDSKGEKRNSERIKKTPKTRKSKQIKLMGHLNSEW